MARDRLTLTNVCQGFCELKYVIFGPHWGLDVKVDSLKENGMVDVIGVSEYFDDVAGRMKIQELGWRAQVATSGSSSDTTKLCYCQPFREQFR